MRKPLLIGILVLLIPACRDSGAPSIDRVTASAPTKTAAQEKAGAIKVALILKSFTNPFFVEMAAGARKAQNETGIDLQIKTATPETSVEQQIRLVESQILAKASAIVISPVDSVQLVPALKKAQLAGIPIVNIDERLYSEAIAANAMKPMPFVGVDSEKAAYQAAKFIADQITRPTEVAIFEGIPGTNTSVERRRGAERAFRENSKLRIVAVGAAHWKSDEAYELAKSVFRDHPNIGAVYCANDLMAIGLNRYLRASGKHRVLFGGFDALDEAKTAIRANQMVVTVDQRAGMQGYVGVMSALKLLRGEAVSDVVLVETELVTAATLKTKPPG